MTSVKNCLKRMESDNVKSTESYLRDLEDKLCDKIVLNWEQDDRFKSLKEMQKYNCGIADAMSLIKNTLESDDFKSPLIKHFETL